MSLLSVIMTCMLKLIPCHIDCFVHHFPCVNLSRNLYSLFLKLVAPNYEVWYFGAKSIILRKPKIFSSHLHSIKHVQQPAPEISSTQHINTAPVHTPVNSTSGMLLSPGLFSLIFGLVIIIIF